MILIFCHALIWHLQWLVPYVEGNIQWIQCMFLFQLNTFQIVISSIAHTSCTLLLSPIEAFMGSRPRASTWTCLTQGWCRSALKLFIVCKLTLQCPFQLNTFQIVIASNADASYAFFLYPEGGIQWIKAQGKNRNMPDARAQAGIISGEGKSMSIKGSGKDQVQKLDR